MCCVFFCFLESSYFSHRCAGWKFPPFWHLWNPSMAAWPRGRWRFGGCGFRGFQVKESRQIRRLKGQASPNPLRKKVPPTSYENPWKSYVLVPRFFLKHGWDMPPDHWYHLLIKICVETMSFFFRGPFDYIQIGYPSICRGPPWALRHLGAAPLVANWKSGKT